MGCYFSCPSRYLDPCPLAGTIPDRREAAMSVPGGPGSMCRSSAQGKNNEFRPFTVIRDCCRAGRGPVIGGCRPVGLAEEGLWQTDFKAALEKAKAEKKYVLVDFTGSDWCSWCIKLRGEVFDKEPFKTDAAKQYVLVELDFPQQKELPKDLKKQNEELRDKYKIQGFPTRAPHGRRRRGHRPHRLSARRTRGVSQATGRVPQDL